MNGFWLGVIVAGGGVAYVYQSGAIGGLATTTQTTTPQGITIERIREQAQMVNAEFVGQVVVPAKHTTQFLGITQSNELVLIAPVRVTAGVNLENATLADGVLTLPPVQILDASVQVEQISIAHYSKDLIAPDVFPQLQTQAQVDALALGVKTACKYNILELANKRGQLYFEQLLKEANITVKTSPVGACVFSGSTKEASPNANGVATR